MHIVIWLGSVLDCGPEQKNLPAYLRLSDSGFSLFQDTVNGEGGC